VLAEIGDDRARFVDSRALKANAGSGPVTKASGRSISITRVRNVHDCQPVSAPFRLRQIGDPMLGIWLHLGDQPLTIVAVFNESDELAAAKSEVAELAGESLGTGFASTGLSSTPRARSRHGD